MQFINFGNKFSKTTERAELTIRRYRTEAPQVKKLLITIGLLASCILLAPGFAKADTTFDVSGQFTFPFAGTFSGTLTVDTALNRLDDVNITFQRETLYPFYFLNNSLPTSTGWSLEAFNDNNQGLTLLFNTAPTAGSLAGLTGGTITSGIVLNLVGGTFPVYQGFSGTISPALSVPTPTVPEPASLMLLALGLLASLPFGVGRRKALRSRFEA